MKKWFCVVLCLMLVVCFGAMAEESHYEAGEAHYEAGEYAQAMKNLGICTARAMA